MLEPFVEWWTSDLAHEIYENLRQLESIQTSFSQWPTLSSSQQRQRRVIVDWMARVCEKANLLEGTVHSAVYCLDAFSAHSDHEELESHAQLAAIAAILVAAKYHEREESVPGIATLNFFSTVQFPTPLVRKMELILLDCLEWHIGEPTIVSFIEYYVIQAVHPDDYHCDQPLTSVEKARRYVKKYVEYFLQICLQEYKVRAYAPSCAAASVMAAIRVCLCLAPTWPKRLEDTTGYESPQLTDCVHILLVIHDEDRRATLAEEASTTSNVLATSTGTADALLSCVAPMQAS